MANRIAGIAYLKVDGTQFDIRGKFKYQIATVKRDEIVGQDGVHGYKEMPVAPYIEGDIDDMPGTRVRRLEDITNATITLELANGKTVVLHNAWWAGDSVVDTEEGSYPVKFCGITGHEQL